MFFFFHSASAGEGAASVVPTNATHAHTATAPALVTRNAVTVNSSSHGQTAGEPDVQVPPAGYGPQLVPNGDGESADGWSGQYNFNAVISATGGRLRVAATTNDAAPHAGRALGMSLPGASFRLTLKMFPHEGDKARVWIMSGGGSAVQMWDFATYGTNLDVIVEPRADYETMGMTIILWGMNGPGESVSAGEYAEFDDISLREVLPTSVVDGTVHGHTATSPTLGARSSIVPGSTVHTQSAAVPAMGTSNAVVPANGSQGQNATSPSVTPRNTVVPASSAQAQATTSPTLATANAVTPANAVQAQSATSPSVGARTVVTANSSTHAQLAAVAGVLTRNSVSPDSANHSLSTGSPIVASKAGVAVNTSSQGHTSTSPSMGGGATVTPAAAFHGLVSNQASVVGRAVVAPWSTAHGQQAGVPALFFNPMLVAASSFHTPASPVVGLTTSNVVVPNNVLHALSSEVPTVVGVGPLLLPQSTGHGVDSTVPAVGFNPVLAPFNTVHALLSSSPGIEEREYGIPWVPLPTLGVPSVVTAVRVGPVVVAEPRVVISLGTGAKGVPLTAPVVRVVPVA